MRAHYVHLTVIFVVVFLHKFQLNARTVDGDRFVLIEGDMMVDKRFIDQTRRIKKRGAILNRLKSRSSLYWSGTSSDGRRIVRIAYKMNTGFFSKFFGLGPEKAFQKAIDQFHKRTCIRFETKTDEDKDYLDIISGTGCWAQIGRRAGEQQLSLGKGCETRGKAIHELMHVLGFLHEQSRKDRHEHVIILRANILEDHESEFKKYRQNTGGLPYDFHSMMHYSNKFFSKNGKDTIQAIIDPDMHLGQEDNFSALDVVRINLLYKCDELQKNLVLYFVTVYTSDENYAGTDNKIDILLDGTSGDSGEIELESTDQVPNPFEKGSKQTFPIISPNIGTFKTLRVRMAKSRFFTDWFAGWKLERVEIEIPDRKKIIRLDYNGWLYPEGRVILKPQR